MKQAAVRGKGFIRYSSVLTLPLIFLGKLFMVYRQESKTAKGDRDCESEAWIPGTGKEKIGACISHGVFGSQAMYFLFDFYSHRWLCYLSLFVPPFVLLVWSFVCLGICVLVGWFVWAVLVGWFLFSLLVCYCYAAVS